MSTGGIEAAHRQHGPWPLLAVLSQSLPLLALRRAPHAVLAVVTAATALQLAVGLPVTNAMMGQAVATAVVVARTAGPGSLVVPTLVLGTSWAGAWIGGVPGLLRFTTVTAVSLALAWVLGDAAGRRAEVRRAMEHELVRRGERVRLREQVVVAEERLRISRELHGLVGEALDVIVVHCQAGGARLGHPEVARHLTVVEERGRAVLTELERFLGYLRRPGEPAPAVVPELPAVPASVPERLSVLGLGRRPGLSSTLPVLGVGFLVLVDALAVGARTWPAAAWPVLSTVLVTVPLLLAPSAPLAVLALLVAVLVGFVVAGAPASGALLAVAVALHAVAARQGQRTVLVAAALSCSACLSAALLGGPQQAGALVGPLLALTAVAVYVGSTSRLAREHNVSLQQRIADAGTEARLRERLALAGERTRVARDLHDSIGHTLSLVVLQAGAARLTAMSDQVPSRATVAAALSAIEASARGALGDLDAALGPLPEDASVPAGPSGTGDLHDLVEGVRAAGTEVALAADPTGDLPRSLQVAILRVVQEALTNVVKHAPGAPADVRVTRSQDALRVTVHNAPATGASPRLPSGGRGLTGMRERLAVVGGELVVGPDGDGGHLVDALIPVPRGPDAPAPLHEAQAPRA